MTDQITAANHAFADTFKFYLMAHNYHWNVEGMFFSSLHELFGNIYEEVFSAVDPLAEHIRAMGAYAPGTLNLIQEYSSLSDRDTDLPDAKGMIADLLAQNDIVLETLHKTMMYADEADNPGFSNFLQERMAQHKKHAWMLRASLK
jgi:starvation-inducible DNA-binding protein